MSKKLVIKGGKLLDEYSGFNYAEKDILVEDGIIKRIEENLEVEGAEYLRLRGEIITPGFIDMHTHVYYGSTGLGVKPDDIGLITGTTTVFDAGSSGASNFEDFKEKVIEKSETRVISLLNAAAQGLAAGGGELKNLQSIDFEAARKVVEKNRDTIKGIKARASASVVGEQGIKPIAMAKELAVSVNLPLVVHIGNYPPAIEQVLDIMQSGDVITHCCHGKPNGLFLEDGTPKEETVKARERGVLFDIGHGVASFNFNTAKKAMKQGFYPDIISTDLHMQNYKGPVYSLVITMSKMLNIGISFEDCVAKVTTAPMKAFGLNKIGAMKEGYFADFTIVTIENSQVKFTDSDGNSIEGNKEIKAAYVIKSGIVKQLS